VAKPTNIDIRYIAASDPEVSPMTNQATYPKNNVTETFRKYNNYEFFLNFISSKGCETFDFFWKQVMI